MKTRKAQACIKLIFKMYANFISTITTVIADFLLLAISLAGNHLIANINPHSFKQEGYIKKAVEKKFKNHHQNAFIKYLVIH